MAETDIILIGTDQAQLAIELAHAADQAATALIRQVQSYSHRESLRIDE